ncbi:MAG: DEAD/DEAH box helicase [Asgard group archaeon]|nr:DEAD/DEAH box helicase [Asgard group archaeon]
MSGKAFQYYVFLMDFDKEIHQANMLILPAKAKAMRIKPLEKARLQFVIEKDRLRPYKYLVLDKVGSEYKRPEEIISVLRKAKGIIIPFDDQPEDYSLYDEFFKTFQIQQPTIQSICRLCMIDQKKVTILPEGYEYHVSGRRACQQCARDELEKELNSKEVKLTTSGKRHFYRILNKVHSVDRVLEAFDYDFRPTKNPDLTLFDTIGNIDDLSKSKPVDNLPIPGDMKKILKSNGIKKLLPIQLKALNAGLLKNENLLIVAGTSSGKTLIGEIAGVTKALKGKRMIYLSPLVALTNQKYEDFKKKYSKEGLRVAIRVGMSKIDVGDEEKYIIDTDYRNANIITATYEAFDLLLRNGKANVLQDVGTFVIDEIQLLSSKDRGPEVDGIIARIKALFPRAQIIGLSATVGNPEELARDLKLNLLLHENRPIPLERHVIMAKNQDEKEIYLRDLVREEYNKKSTYGYFGQSIVFTNSRRHCYELSMKLNRSGLKSIVYHSGLTYKERKRAEDGFAKGKYAAIVTTAALGAGVDFPASQVIFESLAMGIFWLTVAEFHQMIGRAGRLGYHDKGKVALVVQPNRKYHSAMESTEDSVAFELLTEPIEDVEPMMEGENQLSQLLAGIVTLQNASLQELIDYFGTLLGPSETLKISLQNLKDLDMINIYEEGPRATQLGRATSRTFLPPSEASEIKKQLQLLSPLEIAIAFEPFTSIFLNSKMQAEIEKTTKSGYIGSNLFSGSLLEYMESALDKRANLPRLIINTFAKWHMDIFDCKCDDAPWCGCGEKAISRIIVEYRLGNKNLRKIAGELTTKYNLYAYPGDIYRWFDTLIHHLRAVAKLALVFNERNTMKLALNTIKMIERPWIIRKYNLKVEEKRRDE